jgi:hypothetical protein
VDIPLLISTPMTIVSSAKRRWIAKHASREQQVFAPDIFLIDSRKFYFIYPA